MSLLRLVIPMLILIFVFRVISDANADPLDEFHVFARNDETQQFDRILTVNPQLAIVDQEQWCKITAEVMQEKYPKAEFYCLSNFPKIMREYRK